MILDTQETFSGFYNADGSRTGQVITGNALGNNVLDRTTNRSPTGFPPLEDEGVSGMPIYFFVAVQEAFNNLTSLTVELISDSDPNMVTAPVSHISKTVLLAGLGAAAKMVAVPLPSDDYKRYIGVRYTVAGGAPTTGSVFAGFTPDINRNINYPTNYKIDV